MRIEEISTYMQEMNLTYQMVAEQIGYDADRVESAIKNQTSPQDYNVLISLKQHFESIPSMPSYVCESKADYYSEKKQGDYTIHDYYDIPDEVRVELVDGVIYDMAAPTIVHQGIAFEVYRQISNYIHDKKGKCRVYGAPIDVQLDQNKKTMVQPDVLIICDKDKQDDKCIHGAPDWVMEVLSPATKNQDLLIKFNKYKATGVKEYWIVDPEGETVTVYEFHKNEFAVHYMFEEQIPIGIYEGDLKIDMAEIMEYLEV